MHAIRLKFSQYYTVWQILPKKMSTTIYDLIIFIYKTYVFVSVVKIKKSGGR